MFNFHTHCYYCDGQGKPKYFVQEAVKQSFTAFGISSHGPLPFDYSFSIKENNIPAYIAEIKEASAEFPQLPISYGLECDFIPNLSKPFSYFKQTYGLQYIIGGIHMVEKDGQLWFIDGPLSATYDDGLANIFHNDIRLAVKTYFYQLFNMIENEQFDIIAHFDKIKMHNKNRYFLETDKWYQNYIFEAIRLIKEKNLIVEINTRGIYKQRYNGFYPSAWILKEIHRQNIPITISMDAHQAQEISLGYESAKQCALETGFRKISQLIDGKIFETNLQ